MHIIDPETTGLVPEPGHESLPDDYTCLSIPAVVQIPLESRRAYAARLAGRPVGWWYDYRAGLLTRTALADTLTPFGRLRLSAELIGITALAGIFVTGAVLLGLVAVAGLLSLLA